MEKEEQKRKEHKKPEKAIKIKLNFRKTSCGKTKKQKEIKSSSFPQKTEQ